MTENRPNPYSSKHDSQERSFLRKERPLTSENAREREKEDSADYSNINSNTESYFTSRFPLENNKLAYETNIANGKPIPKEYDLCLAIPFGKRAYLWHTFSPKKTNVAMILELNRENQIGNIHFLQMKPGRLSCDFELGTIVSGVLYEEEMQEKVFIVDDIHMYKGQMLSKKTFHLKSGFLLDFLRHTSDSSSPYEYRIRFPVFWKPGSEIPISEIPYNIRHIQYRASRDILPHYNVSLARKPISTPILYTQTPTPTLEKQQKIYNWNWKFDYSKSTYRKTAIFYVKADIMYDVYHLGSIYPGSAPSTAIHPNSDTDENKIVFCQHALILNYKTSIFMNGIFRNIRENANIDAIEESDDESDFENIQENKYVDLDKVVKMECSFHYKFKKWMPFLIIEDPSKSVVSIFSL